MNTTSLRRSAAIAALVPVLVVGGGAAASGVDLAVAPGAYTEETSVLQTGAVQVPITSRFYDAFDYSE